MIYSSTNPKIDLFVNGVYKGSTNCSKTNKEAINTYKIKFADSLQLSDKVTAKRAKK